jgi:hypothetical protein
VAKGSRKRKHLLRHSSVFFPTGHHTPTTGFWDMDRDLKDFTSRRLHEQHTSVKRVARLSWMANAVQGLGNQQTATDG